MTSATLLDNHNNSNNNSNNNNNNSKTSETMTSPDGAPDKSTSSYPDDDPSAAALDAEKHEEYHPAAPSDDSDSEDSEHHGGLPSSNRRRTTTTATTSAGQSLSRTVSEVRDGIQNQRDLELGGGDDDDAEKTAPVNRDDPNLVTWDGPDDPNNPKNWPQRRKWAAVICISFFTFISPVASSMVAPGLPQISRDLAITNDTASAMVLSIFVAAYAVGPLLWGPLSELLGRVIVVQLANAWFLLFNLACGLARSEAQMLAFRFLAGIGGSAPLAIGGAVLGDLFAAEERGRAMSVYSLTPLLGPAVGPIAGGWVAQRTSWRWVFYSTTIACGAIQAAGLFLLQETYAPVLLQRKRARLAAEAGDAALALALHTEFDHPGRSAAQTLAVALTRPFRLLATQPIVQVLSLYMMFLYGITYLVLSTFSGLFAGQYGESPGVSGLNYISLGLGFWLGAQLCAPLQDRIYAALKRRYVPDGGPGRPEFRVPLMVPGAVLLPVGLLIYSWTAEAHTHWIGPNVGSAVFGAAIIMGFQCVQGYVVDSYTRYAASAVGAMTVLRSLAGFGFPLFAPAMYARLGYGVGGTVLAACAVAIGWPSPVFLWFYGPRLRAASQFTS